MSQLNPPPIRDSVDQDSRLGLRASWQAWFSQLFKWLQSLGNSVSNLVSNNTGINTGDQTNITGTAANLSGTPALPNGTTATTQANGDSSTKLANDAFVQAALSYYNTPVAWNGSTDRVLGVGQITQDSFTAATSMPLHIACGDGQVYEIKIVGTYTPTTGASYSILQPNNTVPATNSFSLRGYYILNSTVTGLAATGADGGFRLETLAASIKEGIYTFFTSTATKNSFCYGANLTSTQSGVLNIANEWNDTTTVWSSLGTITMPNAWTGTITVRRVA